MNLKFLHTKKFRHGSVSLALTVVIIAAVILLNAIVTALADKHLWYIDMTPEPAFTFSDEADAILREEMDLDHEVTILFCDEKDAWESNSTQMEVLKTARDIAKRYDNVKIEYKDIFTNPSAVSKYKEEKGKNITSTTVIITSGTESRVYTLDEFFVVDSTTGDVIGYDGEQRFVSALLSVTRAVSPVLGVTTNHGEAYADDSILRFLETLGFEIKLFDLSKEEIPENCRLLLVYNPKSDFIDDNSGLSDLSELDKIEAHLAAYNSMMVFFDKDTPVLPNFEAFLAEWGIAVARDEDNNAYTIEEGAGHSLTANGYTNIAEYVTEGLGADITAPMRDGYANPKKVIFPNATAFKLSSYYRKATYDGITYGVYNQTSPDRSCYNVFESSTDAVAKTNGNIVERASETSPFAYMTITCQSVYDDTMGVKRNSFVLAASSALFATASTLSETSYGNRAVLSYACSTMGALMVPVALDCKYYATSTMSTITPKAANQFTIVLAVVPTSLVFIAGIYVMLRRKYR